MPQNNKIYSFDIFDTLITRKVATPLGVFGLMQEHLKNDSNYSEFSEHVKNNFALIRNKTELWVRENTCINKPDFKDVSFDEIYDAIQINEGLNDEEIVKLKSLEIEIEKSVIVPIYENINLLKRYIRQGAQVFLISDMYFSVELIRMLLKNIDSIFNDIEIYVSSELRITKNCGEMYELIKNKKRISYRNWVHYDDNVHNINIARTLGIDGILFNIPKLPLLLERFLIYEPFNVTIQLICGASRLVCINNKGNNVKRRFGACFTGPILYLYVSWVLDKVKSSNIKNLYFVARDGYIPMLIAKKIVSILNLDINIHYIYGSRKAWRIPTKKNISKFIEICFKEFRNDLSLNYISKLLNIKSDILARFININNYDQILRDNQLWILKQAILNDNNLINYLLEDNKAKKDILIKYLKQEIDFNAGSFAFVEINGSGRTQDFLYDIVKDITNSKFTTFFFHLNSDALYKYKSSNKISFCPTLGKTIYLELLCFANHGTTIGYKQLGEKIIPVFKNLDKKQYKKWNYDEYINGILEFTENITNTIFLKHVPISSLDLYYKYYYYLIYEMDLETANIIGSIPFYRPQSIGEDGRNVEVASPYTWKDLIRMFINGERKKEFEYISLIRTGERNRKIIQFIERNKNFKSMLQSFLSVRNEYNESKIHKVITVLGLKFKFNIKNVNILQDLHSIIILLNFLLRKKKKENLSKIEKIKFITFREPLIKGGGGGQGAALSMNKAILPPLHAGIPIEYIFEIPNKYSIKDRNIGANIEFSGIEFAISECKNDKNTIYITHEEATAFGLWLMGKNYIMFSHIQGARVEESKNFGYKFSKVSEFIIKFCEGLAMKKAFEVCFPSIGAYRYYINSPYAGAREKDFKLGPIVYNTLWANNKMEQYKDIVYDPNYITILSSGSLTLAKGVDRTLNLVEELLKQLKGCRKIRHIFIGEGVMSNYVNEKLERLAQKYHNFSYIRINRCSEGQMPYLQSICDLFIVLHRIAIFDLATLEVMSKGKAIVLSDVGGNPEFNVENNIIMWNEEEENYTEVAHKILNSNLKSLGEKNFKVYEKYFGKLPYIKSYNNLLNNFCNTVLNQNKLNNSTKAKTLVTVERERERERERVIPLSDCCLKQAA